MTDLQFQIVFGVGSFLLFIVGSFVLYRLIQWSFQRHAKKMAAEYIKRFPNRRCHVCSFHWLGIREGFVSHDEPIPEHDCPGQKKDGAQ